jgi:hypothetical protein
MSQITSTMDLKNLHGRHIVRSRPISAMNAIQLKSWVYLIQLAFLILDDDFDLRNMNSESIRVRKVGAYGDEILTFSDWYSYLHGLLGGSSLVIGVTWSHDYISSSMFGALEDSEKTLIFASTCLLDCRGKNMVIQESGGFKARVHWQGIKHRFARKKACLWVKKLIMTPLTPFYSHLRMTSAHEKRISRTQFPLGLSSFAHQYKMGYFQKHWQAHLPIECHRNSI